MGSSPGFGSIAYNYCSPSSDSVSLRLQSVYFLTLLPTLTRGPIMQKVRRHSPSFFLSKKSKTWFAPTDCEHAVSVSLSTPDLGCFFTFPLRYLFTIGHPIIFSLGRWSCRIPTKFHVFRGTRGSRQTLPCYVYRTLTFFGASLQLPGKALLQAPQPQRYVYLWFGLFRFRSPLLSESLLFSFPAGTKMVQFSAYAFSTKAENPL